MPNIDWIVEIYAKRALPLKEASQLARYIAITRELGLPYLSTLVTHHSTDEFWQPLLEAHSTSLIPLLVELSTRDAAPRTVRLWLERDKESAGRALLELAGSDERAITCILKYELFNSLASLKEEIQHYPSVSPQMHSFIEDFEGKYASDSTSFPDWWRDCVAEIPSDVSIPEWITVDLLSDIRLEGRLLQPSHKRYILRALTQTTNDGIAPLISRCKDQCKAELTQWLETLLFQWSEAGRPEGDLWVIAALPHLPMEGVIPKLSSLLVVAEKERNYSLSEELVRAIALSGTEDAIDILRTLSRDSCSFSSSSATKYLSVAEQISQGKGICEPPMLLTKADRSFVNWTSHSPRKREIRPPFDHQRCCEEYLEALFPPSGDMDLEWPLKSKALQSTMTVEEAHFWLLALCRDAEWKNPYYIPSLARATIDGSITPALAVAKLINCRIVSAEIVGPLVTLYSPMGALRILEEVVEKREDLPPFHFTDSFMSWVDRESIDRGELRSLLSRTTQPRRKRLRLPVSLYLAGHLGFHEELLEALQALPDGLFATMSIQDLYWLKPELILFTIQDRKVLIEEALRLRLSFPSSEGARNWLALTGDQGLEVIARSIVNPELKSHRTDLFEALLLAEGPEMVEQLFLLLAHAVIPHGLERWMIKRPHYSLPMLIDACRRGGTCRTMALKFLSTPSFDPHKEKIRDLISTERRELRQLILERIDRERGDIPEEVLVLLQRTPSRSMELIFNLDILPELTVNNVSLDVDYIERVVSEMSLTATKGVFPLLTSLKKHAKGLPEFAWEVFIQSRSADIPLKEKWPFTALGILGDDETALKLTPIIKELPSLGLFSLAVTGLEALKEIGTDVALGQLTAIALNSRSRALRDRAMKLLQGIAEERGISQRDLEDRLVPTLGLTRDSTVSFDYGARQFTAHLDVNLKPILKDSSGVVRENLPRTTLKDDWRLADEARREWKVFKKSLGETAKNQALRLEAAMVTGRIWKHQDFQKLVVDHPLLHILSQRVLWRATHGSVSQLFRVSEEREYLGIDDDVLRVDDIAEITVPHPLSLSETDKVNWSAHFSDYKINQLFPQLSRPIFTLLPFEQDAHSLSRFSGSVVEGMSIVGTLEKFGWNRGYVEDGGIYKSHLKQFEGCLTTAMLEYEKGISFSRYEVEPQDLKAVTFYKGVYRTINSSSSDDIEPLRLGDVPQIVISEVLKELSELTSKAVS